MGRRGRSKVRRVSSRFFKKSRSRRKSGAVATTATLVGAGVYGAARGALSNLLAPLTSRLPFGGVEDEVALLMLSMAASKGNLPLIGKAKLVKDIGKAGVVIEAARIGDALGGGLLQGALGGRPANGMQSFQQTVF